MKPRAEVRTNLSAIGRLRMLTRAALGSKFASGVLVRAPPGLTQVLALTLAAREEQDGSGRRSRLRELARAQASMGQEQSQPAQAAEEPSPLPAEPAPAPSQAPSPAPSSLEELAAEAMSFSEDNNDSIDVKVQKALECPCVADLKSGPCGSGFIDAFSCFLRSTEEEKGSDCVKPFIALQNCIKENPEAFSKEILEEEENDEEAEKSNLKVRAPAWSREAKPKL